jgi:RNA polymerase sigma factor (sigma-70 family)
MPSATADGREPSANRPERVKKKQRREDRFISAGVDTFLRAAPFQVHVRPFEPVGQVFGGDEVFDRLDQEQEFAPLASRLREVDPSLPDFRRARFRGDIGRRTGTGFAREPSEDLLALDEALNQLAAKDPVKADVVKLRYFAGLSSEEAAHALGISRATADRYWTYARAWLHREVSGSRSAAPDSPPVQEK